MRSCLTAFLFTLLLIGAVIGLGAVTMGQVRTGLCTDQTLRVILSLLGGFVALAVVLIVLLALVNLELLEKSLSGAQISVIAFSLTVVGLGVASFFTYHSAAESCPRVSKADSLAGVCQGIALDANRQLADNSGRTAMAAASVLTSNPIQDIATPERLVVLGEQGQAISWTDQARREWSPGDLSEISLVVCASEPQKVLLETCTYGGGIRVNRYREDISVRLVDPWSGETLARETLSAEPPACQPLGIQELPRLHARLEFAALKEWVQKVTRGEMATDVAPTPNTERVLPTLTPAPTNTPLPSPTPQLTGRVKTGSRVRSGPTTEDKILTGLTKDDTVIILGKNASGTWLKILIPGGENGWIFGELVELPIPIDQIPAAP